MKTNKLHVTLVLIQFGGIIFFLISGKILTVNFWIAILYFMSFCIGIWAIISMNKHTISIFPEVRDHDTLVVTGPYKFIRHPMYTAVLLFLLALLKNDFTILRCLAFLIVGVVLISKIKIEEKILINKFPEYVVYQSNTKKIIPYIF